MTYCVGLYLDEGLVLLADTRTNAGVDNISTFSKLQVFEEPGERVVYLMSSGNLAITQAVSNLVTEGLEDPDTGKLEKISTVPSMFRAAQLVGRAVRHVYRTDGPMLREMNIGFECSMLVAGQVKGRTMRLFQVYAAGNFIQATPETPYLQIGEHKYGKPILDRAATYSTPLAEAVKLALVSMDSTLRSNLTVGMPIDLMVYHKDRLTAGLHQRIEDDDKYFTMLRKRWSDSLRKAYAAIPAPEWGI